MAVKLICILERKEKKHAVGAKEDQLSETVLLSTQLMDGRMFPVLLQRICQSLYLCK